jgi:hypothetical protein
VLNGVPQRHGHGAQPEVGRLVLAQFQQVEIAGIAGVDAVLDPVETGGDECAECQVRERSSTRPGSGTRSMCVRSLPP